MKQRTLEEHLFGSGPKRILSLDGGGIRGALSLGFLKRMEDILRERAGGSADFRLCDYFDLIGGTSTGSIIASALAMGFSVNELQEIYVSLSDEVFKKPIWRLGLYSSKFPDEPLVEALKEFLGDETMGSDKLKTGLFIVTKRLDTGSPWILHNNPRGKYFDTDEDHWIPNKDYLVRQVVRASTAAPHYFEPEGLQISKDITGAFVDGGVSPYNNPALMALKVATLKGYGLGWEMGDDKLLLVSVGTGFIEHKLDPAEIMDMPAIQLAGQSVLSIMADTDRLLQTILQWISNSPTPWHIDSEMGDLMHDFLGGMPLISYLRYTVPLDSEWLQEKLNITMTEKETRSIYAMDQPENVEKLGVLGTAAAKALVAEDHFGPAFDIE